MQSYRKRIAVQKRPVKPIQRQEQAKIFNKKRYPEVKKFLQKAIRMHQEVLKQFEPFSDEWTICQNALLKYRADFELLEYGTYLERKEVIEKYG